MGKENSNFLLRAIAAHIQNFGERRSRRKKDLDSNILEAEDLEDYLAEESVEDLALEALEVLQQNSLTDKSTDVF